METLTAKSENRKRYKNINRFIIDRAVKDFANELPDEAIVLDIGAAGGHYRKLFREKKYIAIDLGLEQSSYKGLDVVGDICFLPFKKSAINYALCIEVLEHVYEREKLLSELKRVLKKGGKILLTTPLCLGEHMKPHDFFRYTRFGLERAIVQSGLKLDKIEARGGYFVFLSYHLKRFPEYLTSSNSIPAWIKKSVQRTLHPIFAYALPFLLHGFDHLDKKMDATLGYNCIILKDSD